MVKADLKWCLQVEGAEGCPLWQMVKKAKGKAEDHSYTAGTSFLPG